MALFRISRLRARCSGRSRSVRTLILLVLFLVAAGLTPHSTRAQEPAPPLPPQAPTRADVAAGILPFPAAALKSGTAQAIPDAVPDGLSGGTAEGSAAGGASAGTLHSWTEPSVAPDLASCCRNFVPTVSRIASPAGGEVSPLPRLINGTFDAEGGWQQKMLCVTATGATETNFPLISQTDTLAASLGTAVETTLANAAWLGGGSGGSCSFRLDVTHRLTQTVSLPADYGVRMQFDALVQSAESTCGIDIAEVLADGSPLSISLPLCTGPAAAMWSERSVDLSALQGRTVTLEFRVTGSPELNSNLWLDNVTLCGLDARLPAADQCPVQGWQEPAAGSGQGRGISATSGRSYDPSIAISPVGRTYVAWADKQGTNPGEIYVRRWTGLAWTTLGTSASAGGVSNTPTAESAHPVVAVSGAPIEGLPAERAGIPYIAWHDSASGDTEIYIRQWNGSAWVEVGAGSASGGGVSDNTSESFQATLVIDGALRPIVAWTDDRPNPQNPQQRLSDIYVKRWNGSAWVEMGTGSATGGGISNTAGESGEAALAAGPGGVIYLARSDATSGNAEIYVRRWSGSAWVEVSPGSASGGGISNNADASYAPAIAIDSQNRPVVAWVDRSDGDTEIYLKRLEGQTWVELGNSATAGGLSNNDGASLDPSVVSLANDLPLVAWTDLSGFNAEIYVRRWTGSRWAAYGNSGSDFMGGISNTSGFSDEPVAIVDRAGVVSVAWSDDSAGNGEIYVRRYSPE